MTSPRPGSVCGSDFFALSPLSCLQRPWRGPPLGRSAAARPCDDVSLAGRASVSLLGPGSTVAAFQAVGRIWRENVGLPPARPGKPPNAVPPPHAQVASLLPQAGHWPWLAGGLPGQGLHHPPGLPSPLTAVGPLGGTAPRGMPRPRGFHPPSCPRWCVWGAWRTLGLSGGPRAAGQHPAPSPAGDWGRPPNERDLTRCLCRFLLSGSWLAGAALAVLSFGAVLVLSRRGCLGSWGQGGHGGLHGGGGA